MITNDDMFIANSAFTSSRRRFFLPVAIAADQRALQRQKRREWIIDNKIVKVMMVRKRMEHAALVSEVARRLLNDVEPLSVSEHLIASRIPAVIERECMARTLDANGSWTGEYDYLA